ncbi:hypothetical protein LCGC14_2274430 [marine sediment metagenome]|uniref:Uncharacterized protein n=1 Tax=marine sediment metagenome TaxID=412755 RepID=A0A0F9CVZ7_9ZZZZ
MTQELITAEDLRHHIAVFVGIYGDRLDDANIELLTAHLHGNLAMIAQARLDKRLEAGEELRDKAEEYYSTPEDWRVRRALRTALDAYEEVAPDA